MHRLDPHRSVIRLLIAGLLVLTAAPAIVEAAKPKKGSSYVGTIAETSARLSKRVVLKVSNSGIGRARLECSGTRVGLSSRFEIADSGRFTAKRTTGSLLVWRLKGRFGSSETARAKLYLPAACDGRGGKLTLELR